MHNLDLAAPLPQVLADSEFTYLYGLTRLAQESAARREYFLAETRIPALRMSKWFKVTRQKPKMNKPRMI